jgi:hypothetical protein
MLRACCKSVARIIVCITCVFWTQKVHARVQGFQECYKGATSVLQEFYKGVTSMLQGCYTHVTRVLPSVVDAIHVAKCCL